MHAKTNLFIQVVSHFRQILLFFFSRGRGLSFSTPSGGKLQLPRSSQAVLTSETCTEDLSETGHHKRSKFMVVLGPNNEEKIWTIFMLFLISTKSQMNVKLQPWSGVLETTPKLHSWEYPEWQLRWGSWLEWKVKVRSWAWSSGCLFICTGKCMCWRIRDEKYEIFKSIRVYQCKIPSVITEALIA